MGTTAEKGAWQVSGDDTADQPTLEAFWLERIADRDKRAFEALYTEFAPRVFRFAVRMINDETKAEEVVNDVMVEVWKSAGQFKGRSAASTWIFSIARHRALNAIRGKKLSTTALDDARDVKDESEDPMTATDENITQTLLKEAINHLSTEHREVVELTFFQGLNYKEIAQIAQCPENTVKTRMFHARKKLKPILESMGISGEFA